MFAMNVRRASNFMQTSSHPSTSASASASAIVTPTCRYTRRRRINNSFKKTSSITCSRPVPLCVASATDESGQDSHQSTYSSSNTSSSSSTATPLSEFARRQLLVSATQRIKSLGRRGLPMQAIEALAALGRESVQPDVIIATATVEACVQNGEMELALRVFKELFGRNVNTNEEENRDSGGNNSNSGSNGKLTPDEISFTTLIRGYSSSPSTAVSNSSNSMSLGSSGFNSSSQSSSSVDWIGIHSILVLMRSYNVIPSTLTYNTLLQLCSQTHDVERGIHIIEQMSREGVEVNNTTLTAVKNRRALRSHLKKVYSNIPP